MGELEKQSTGEW